MQKCIQKIISFVNQYPWTPINKVFSVTEITIPLPSWDKARIFVLVRKTLPENNNGQLMFDIDEFKYEYQAIVTNIDYFTTEEIFHEHNQHCDIENKIDELKEGFVFSQNSQQNKKCNELLLLIIIIAYNLHNWFKQSILPKRMQKHEITTLRKILYYVPGNLVGNGYYRHIKFAPSKWLERVINYIRHRLKCFCKKIVFA